MAATKNNNIISIASGTSTGFGHVHIIEKITSLTSTVISSTINNSSTYTTLVDGYFIISEIILPTTNTGSYYISGSEVKLGNVSVVLADLLELVPIETSTELVIYYYVNIYYIDLIKSKLLKNLCNCSCMSAYDKLTLDTLMMGLTIIPILETDDQLAEAGRMIDQLSMCTGITNSGCNCYG